MTGSGITGCPLECLSQCVNKEGVHDHKNMHHMHRFQYTSITQGPEQIVVGTGGVSLASIHPAKQTSIQFGKQTGIVNGLSRFAYMTIDIGENSWQGKLVTPAQSRQPLATCGSSKSPVCKINNIWN